METSDVKTSLEKSKKVRGINPRRMQSGRTVGKMLAGKRGGGSSEHTSKAQQPLYPQGKERFPLGKYNPIGTYVFKK